MIESLVVRPARQADAATVADLLLEGFGHEYGGALLKPAGRRMMQRVHALPGRLTGVYLLESEAGRSVAMAGLRTREVRPQIGWPEEQITMEELGIATALWLELRASLNEPSVYYPRGDEAYLYNVVVTAAWRGKGVGDRLLNHLHAEADRRGKRRVLLEVIATNHHAIALYHRHGYTVLRTRRGLLSLLRLGAPPRLLMCKTLASR